MRVAVYHNLPPGGALRVVREFLSRVGDDLQCDVFTLDFGAADAYAYADPDFRLRDLSPWVGRQHRERVPLTGSPRIAGTRLGWALGIAGIRRAERRVATRINTGGYDVAYVHGCWLSQTPSILRDLTIPRVYFMQEVRRATFEPGYSVLHTRPRSVKGFPGWLVSQVTERVLRRRDLQAAPAPDLVLCNSAYSAGAITRAYGLDPAVTYPGVESSVFTVPATPAPSGSARHVVSVGGLESFKGHHLVVEALGLLPAGLRPGVHLVYQRCDEDYRSRLIELARTRGVRVTEQRGISDAALAALYASSAATVLAAQLEPFGLVALESIACGTPVVAAREGGYVETITDGRNGLLVDRTPEALAEALERVLSDGWPLSRAEVRDSILPFWDAREAVSRQTSRLRSVIGPGGTT